MVLVQARGGVVEARGRRDVWRASPGAQGGVHVTQGPHVGPMTRVDDDVPRLTRAATRLFAEDPDAAEQFVELTSRATGQARVKGEPAVRAIVRVTLPLLAPQPPWPAPALPTALAPQIHDAFRATDPREAAVRLWPGRVTRPVIAALAAFLCPHEGDGTVAVADRGIDHPDREAWAEQRLDVFALTVVHAVGPLLQPDQIAAVLRATPAPASADTLPLDHRQAERLRATLAPLAARTIVDLSRAAVSDPEARARARHVANCSTAPAMRKARSWTQIAAAGLLVAGRPPQAARLPVPEVAPFVPPPVVDPNDGLTLHLVTETARLLELGRTMRNCLDTYTNRLHGEHRIVEFRRDGAVVYAAHLQRRRIITLEAPGNRRPPAREVPTLRRMLHAEGLLGGRPPGPVATPLAAARQGRGGTALLRREDLARTPVSIQSLAARIVEEETVRPTRPDSFHRDAYEDDTISWCELATALWSVGALPQLPDPTRPATRRIMLDVAAELAAGGRPATASPPDATTRRNAHDRLRERAAAHGPGWWPCLVMADVLARPIQL